MGKRTRRPAGVAKEKRSRNTSTERRENNEFHRVAATIAGASVELKKFSSFSVYVFPAPARASVFEVVVDRADHADGFRDAGVRAEHFAPAFVAGAACICGKDRKHALIRAADRAYLAAGIRSKSIGRGARVPRGLGDHVGFDGVEPVEFVDHSAPLA